MRTLTTSRSFSVGNSPLLSEFPPSATKASIVSDSSLAFAAEAFWVSMTFKNSANSISPLPSSSTWEIIWKISGSEGSCPNAFSVALSSDASIYVAGNRLKWSVRWFWKNAVTESRLLTDAAGKLVVKSIPTEKFWKNSGKWQIRINKGTLHPETPTDTHRPASILVKIIKRHSAPIYIFLWEWHRQLQGRRGGLVPLSYEITWTPTKIFSLLQIHNTYCMNIWK